MATMGERINPVDGETQIPQLRVEEEETETETGGLRRRREATASSTSSSAGIESSSSLSSSSSSLWNDSKSVLPRNAGLVAILTLVLALLALPAVRSFIGNVATRPFYSPSALALDENYLPGYWFGAGKFSLPLVGEPLEFMRSTFRFTLDRARKFGHVALGRPFGYDVAFLSGADGIKAFYDHGNRSMAFPQQFITGILGGHTILNMQDDQTSPRFHERRDSFERALGYKRPSVIDQYLPIVNRIMSRHLRLWEQQTVKDGKTLRLVDSIHLMCLEIATTIILGIEDGGSLAKRLLPFVSDALNAGQAPPLPIPGTYFHKGKQSSAELVNFFSTLIEQHLNSSGIVISDKIAVSSRGGVLSSLFPLSRLVSGKGKRSQLPPIPHGLETLAKRWKTHLQEKGGETLETLATEVLHTVLATTALVGNGIADTIVALDKSPETRRKLAYEVEEMTSGLPWQPEATSFIQDADLFYDFSANSKGSWSHYNSALLSKLHYNHAVSMEVRRLFPFVAGMFARAVRDFKVKSGGYNGEEEHDKVVKRDTTLVGSFYATGLDPTLWSDPLTFNPSRFLGPHREPLRRPDGAANDARFSWVPHGSGAHQCPGINLAESIMELFTIHLVKDGVVWHLPPQNLDQNLQLFNPEPSSGLVASRWRATGLETV